MRTTILLVAILFCIQSFSKDKSAEVFSNPEANFKLVMEKILSKHLDKNITKEELFKAATQGMLASLNSGEQTWNKLLSPDEMKNMKEDLSGKVTGIGVSIKFDEHTGYGQILKAIPGSAAEKAGLQMDDQILSVDDMKFKGRQFIDMVTAIRGETGKFVKLKVLREDKILSLNIKRQVIPWTPVELEKVDSATAILSIGFFNEQTPQLVEQKLNEVNKANIKKLIVDVRDNDGGSFDHAVKVAELFLPENAIVASTKNRQGVIEKFLAKKSLLNKNVQVLLLTNKKTFSGAELFTAALKENKKSKIVGESTFGKWNAQTVESLSNRFAIKYTTMEFNSPLGNAYQGIGIKPDLEVSLPKDSDVNELRVKFDIPKRLEFDLQLKAALELVKTI